MIEKMTTRAYSRLTGHVYVRQEMHARCDADNNVQNCQSHHEAEMHCNRFADHLHTKLGNF